ncbi:MAG: hypothetical protein ACJ79H_01950 [Myxococcales bacterium]
MLRSLIIPLVLAAVLGLGVATAVGYYLPPYPRYGIGGRGSGLEYWMAGRVNPPGKCGFTFTFWSENPSDPKPVYDAFIVQPYFGGGPGTITSGGMMIGTPTGTPPGSYVVVYGVPVSSGYVCEDEQGYKYKPVWGTVVNNPTLLPDPNLRRVLAAAVGIITALLVFGLGYLISRYRARSAAVPLIVPD